MQVQKSADLRAGVSPARTEGRFEDSEELAPDPIPRLPLMLSMAIRCPKCGEETVRVRANPSISVWVTDG
jgi:hypothetical protein